MRRVMRYSLFCCRSKGPVALYLFHFRYSFGIPYHWWAIILKKHLWVRSDKFYHCEKQMLLQTDLWGMVEGEESIEGAKHIHFTANAITSIPLRIADWMRQNFPEGASVQVGGNVLSIQGQL